VALVSVLAGNVLSHQLRAHGHRRSPAGVDRIGLMQN